MYHVHIIKLILAQSMFIIGLVYYYIKWLHTVSLYSLTIARLNCKSKSTLINSFKKKVQDFSDLSFDYLFPTQHFKWNDIKMTGIIPICELFTPPTRYTSLILTKSEKSIIELMQNIRVPFRKYYCVLCINSSLDTLCNKM